MINRLLYRLTAKLPCRLITLESGPYLERYYLGQLFGVTFYLHRFVSSDSEEHLHNHPWGWGASLILAGSYVEERAIDFCPCASDSGCLTTRIHRRWYNRADGNTCHRIHDAEPGTWSLFLHGPRVIIETDLGTRFKGWGFFKRGYLVGSHDCAVFTPVVTSVLDWWKNSKIGAEAGRVEL